MMTISETVSETPRPRPGRPRVMPEEWEAVMDASGLLTETATRRGRLNVFHRMRALRELGSDFPWLADKERMAAGAAGAWKPTILSELGRIEDVEELRAVAAELCEARPKTRAAVAMIRRYRLGQGERRGTPGGLNDCILRAIDDYLMRFPGTTWGQTLEALNDAYSTIQDNAGGAAR